MSGPCQVHEVEEGVQTDYQECYITLGKSAKQHIQEPIKFRFIATTAEIPFKVS